MKKFVDNLISVIIPVYNAERFISQTIESIHDQTYGEFEILLVDDCSNDNSAAIIKDLAVTYQDIIYIKQDKNMGAAVARNTALERSKGRYVAFLDSDDIWLPEKTKKQMDLMKSTSTPFAYTAIDMIDESGILIKSKRNLSEKATYRSLLYNTMIATSSVIIDRSQLGDFRMPLRRSGQDYGTWLQLLRNDIVARGINEALVHYRRTNNSLSSNKFKSITQVWDIQTKDEGINKIRVLSHVCCFIFNGVRKHIF